MTLRSKRRRQPDEDFGDAFADRHHRRLDAETGDDRRQHDRAGGEDHQRGRQAGFELVVFGSDLGLRPELAAQLRVAARDRLGTEME